MTGAMETTDAMKRSGKMFLLKEERARLLRAKRQAWDDYVLAGYTAEAKEAHQHARELLEKCDRDLAALRQLGH
jgi:hypothetical protein